MHVLLRERPVGQHHAQPGCDHNAERAPDTLRRQGLDTRIRSPCCRLRPAALEQTLPRQPRAVYQRGQRATRHATRVARCHGEQISARGTARAGTKGGTHHPDCHGWVGGPEGVAGEGDGERSAWRRDVGWERNAPAELGALKRPRLSESPRCQGARGHDDALRREHAAGKARHNRRRGDPHRALCGRCARARNQRYVAAWGKPHAGDGHERAVCGRQVVFGARDSASGVEVVGPRLGQRAGDKAGRDEDRPRARHARRHGGHDRRVCGDAEGEPGAGGTRRPGGEEGRDVSG